MRLHSLKYRRDRCFDPFIFARFTSAMKAPFRLQQKSFGECQFVCATAPGTGQVGRTVAHLSRLQPHWIIVAAVAVRLSKTVVCGCLFLLPLPLARSSERLLLRIADPCL